VIHDTETLAAGAAEIASYLDYEEQSGRLDARTREGLVLGIEAMRDWGKPAREIHAAAIAALDEREREFLLDLLGDTDVHGLGSEGLLARDLDALRELYDVHYDDIWLGGGDGLAADNERHEADDYYQGYVAGARMVLALLLEAFEIREEETANV
jgi:hypothetical protein